MKSDTTFKVLITTSGTGSRLGDLTKYTNKALVRVGKRPAISYIVESYPKSTVFVVTVGYHGDQVREFLKLVYPDRKFEFVPVDKYEGKGTSLGYSMLQAEKKLHCPFVYHACDTIISDQKIPKPTANWIGGYKDEGSSHYASFDTFDGKVQKMHDKGMLEADFLHIGLIGIQDYQFFWSQLRKLYKENPNNSGLNDVEAIDGMLQEGSVFKAVEFKKWHDIGNVESLNKAREEIRDSFRILDKADESIFIFDKMVVKFFANEKIVADRVARGKILSGMAPKIIGASKHFYAYQYAKGHLYSKVATPDDFKRFLEWVNKNLWKPVREVSEKKFKDVCYNFYYQKTLERVGSFLKTRSIRDSEMVINGERVPTVKKMLSMIDFDELCSAEQTNFHGDFILDNLLKNGSKYILLDWRQNFGGLLKAGDRYYDISKLNHNLTINHEIVNKDLFTVLVNKHQITCDILRKENLVQCQKVLWSFLEREGYDLKKVRILTAIIWLNMSPLHHHPFDLFLFYFGKLNLWRAINDK